MKNFSKILIANRGEIALRVMRTAQQMGYTTVAVYSEIDIDSPHTQYADQSVCVGSATAAESYLCIDKIIEAAKTTKADAIHPGYGFLSENTDFAQACEDTGIVFIGPPASAIELMGSKRLSKLAMLENDVPCIPGYEGAEQDEKTLIEQASTIGFPIMIKASAGGGGRGMRIVHELESFSTELEIAKTEAQSAFGNDEVIIERALVEPRHIEVQVFADRQGNVVHLGERDCSIQRRHQKIVEESPSPLVDAKLRAKLSKAALNAVRSCNYVGAGTVEFLVDKNGEFYFLEMNTRLQVEHPVTEMITGLDLVAWQILVADGNSLPLTQDQITFNGHAMEVRLYAEDPRNDFFPQTGTVLDWQVPTQQEHLRVDDGIQTGQIISPYYDPLMAKIICWAENRRTAIARLDNALKQSVLLGINSNKQFLREVLANADFVAGNATTAFLAQHYPNSDYQLATPSDQTVAIAGLFYYCRSQYRHPAKESSWNSAASIRYPMVLEYKNHNFQICISHKEDIYQLEIGSRCIEIVCTDFQAAQGVCAFSMDGQRFAVHFKFDANSLCFEDASGHYSFADESYRPAETAAAKGATSVKAPMDGIIVEVLIQKGDSIKSGQVVAVLEAMKMAHQLKSTVTGKVSDLGVTVGQQVQSQQMIATILPSAESN